MLRCSDLLPVAITGLVFTSATLLLAAALPAQPTAFVTSLDDVVTVVDLTTLSVTDTIPTGADPSGIAVARLDTLAYVTNQSSGTLSILNTTTGLEIATVSVGNAPVAVALGADETQAYVTLFGDSALAVVDARLSVLVATIPLPAPPIGVDADATTVYVSDFATNLTAIDVATNTIRAAVDLGSTGTGLAISPKGIVYVALIAQNRIAQLDATSLADLGSYTTGTGPFGLALGPGGNRLYVANQLADSVTVIDTDTDAVLAVIVVGNKPTGVAVSADGSLLAVVNQGSDSVSVIDTVQLTVIGTVLVGTIPIGFGHFIDGDLPIAAVTGARPRGPSPQGGRR